MRILFSAFFLLFAAGCSTISPSIPEGYVGAKARLHDSGVVESRETVQVFAVIELEGKTINNSLRETWFASQNQGFNVNLRVTEREIPARKMKIKLTGTHMTGAPIRAIVKRAEGTFFSVEGEAEFTPEPGETYTVTGALAKEKSCVWIMRDSNQTLATNKLCSP